MSADPILEARYEALIAWAAVLPHNASVAARVGSHTGYLSVTTTVRADGSKRVSVRVRDQNRGARRQYQTVLPYHLADGTINCFQIRAENGRYVNWTPEVTA